jgi:hypothetical protein
MTRCTQCYKRATFGTVQGKPIVCKSHSEHFMKDVRHPSCYFCHRRPSYAWHGPPTHCHLHKVVGMKNVKHKRCSAPGCDTHASYGYCRNKPLFCQKHKDPGMSNVKATVCCAPGCRALKPKYGNSSTGRKFCVQHYNPRQHWKLTTCIKCSSIATHSEGAQLPFLYCPRHSPDHCTPATKQSCTTCGDTTLCNSFNLCYNTCQPPATGSSSSSEQELRQFLSDQQLQFVYNRCPPNSSSKKRPDFVFETPHGFIIIENDEHKHCDLSQSQEQARMEELHHAFLNHTHFIRFNPDVTPQHTEKLTVRHQELYSVLLFILNNAKAFFQQHQGLTVRYMYY